ncbi:MAG TPA: hypothetical protein PLV68_07710, partial [Ilumatobacteraceae bacterium]|nr:hypothetical protein [Ilumatobacteraceae bacterium]
VAPWVRTATARGVVSVLTTPDVTTGSERPGALPRREIRTPRRTRSQIRQERAAQRFTGIEQPPREKGNYGVAVSALFAIAVLFGVWALWSRLGDGTQRAASPTTTATPTVPPIITDAATTTTAAATTTTAPAASVPLPPNVEFDCPSPGKGWQATLIASEFLQDPQGYHVWYSVRLSPLTYWGLFKSGLRTPEPIGPV